jgi:hypothetical protein
MKRVIRSDKPVTLLLLLWSHKCDFGAEPRCRIIATSAVKGLRACTLTGRKWTVRRGQLPSAHEHKDIPARCVAKARSLGKLVEDLSFVGILNSAWGCTDLKKKSSLVLDPLWSLFWSVLPNICNQFLSS